MCAGFSTPALGDDHPGHNPWPESFTRRASHCRCRLAYRDDVNGRLVRDGLGMPLQYRGDQTPGIYRRDRRVEAPQRVVSKLTAAIIDPDRASDRDQLAPPSRTIPSAVSWLTMASSATSPRERSRWATVHQYSSFERVRGAP